MEHRPASEENSVGETNISNDTEIEVMDDRERAVLNQEENRKRLHEAAVLCIRNNDIRQHESEFSWQYYLNEGGEDEYDLKPLCNPELFGKSAALLEPYAEKTIRPPYESHLIGLLAEALHETGGLSAEPVDYTSAADIVQRAPEVMKHGLRALTLRKVVQGSLRDQVNGYLILNEGIDGAQAQARWKQLDTLAGARNGAIDILKCFADKEFVRESHEAENPAAWHQLKSDCCCALHFFKEELYQKLSGLPVRSLGEAQTIYMGSGGDHRAFSEAKDEELSAFLRGERGVVKVSHRIDYLTAAAQASDEQVRNEQAKNEQVRDVQAGNRQAENKQAENKQAENKQVGNEQTGNEQIRNEQSRKRISLETLHAEEYTKKERRSEIENRSKSSSLHTPGHSRSYGSGRSSGDSGIQSPAGHSRR